MYSLLLLLLLLTHQYHHNVMSDINPVKKVHADVSLQVQKCNNVLENYTNNCANKTADMQL